MERKYLKAINFDLDTHLLGEHHPSGDYHKAYYDMKRFFKGHNFSHKQGSGYVSNVKLTIQDIYELINDLCETYPWITKCVNEFDVTNVGTQYGLAEDIRSGGEELNIEI